MQVAMFSHSIAMRNSRFVFHFPRKAVDKGKAHGAFHGVLPPHQPIPIMET